MLLRMNRRWFSLPVMDDLSFVQSKLKEMAPGDLVPLAEASGVPAPTLAKIRLNATKNPRFGTVQKLAAYLRSVETAA
jgi:hypothetical protein